MTASTRLGRPRGQRARGDVIRVARAKRGWTAEALAEAAGVTSRTVRKAESSHAISATTAAALAGVLGLDVQEIFAAGSELDGRVSSAGLGVPEPEHAHNLVGREAAVIAAQSMLRTVKTLCLAGPSGIGKTTLATSLANDAQQQVFWIPSRERRGRRAATALKRQLCGVLEEGETPPKNAGEKEVDVRFAQLTKRIAPLLVFDDVASRRFIDAFSALPCAVIVTTAKRSVQRRFANATHELAPLSDTAALDLLGKLIGEARICDSSATDRGRILQQLAGCPRAVLTASAVLEREKFLSIGDYDGHWRDRWSADTASHSQRLSPAKLSVDAGRCLSVLIDADAPRSLQEVAAATQLEKVAAARAVSELFDAYLCEEVPHPEVASAAFECPDVVRAVIWR
jgi:transcriptional regulator with XRE-family HTH domain